MTDGHIHIERGPYTLDWIQEFVDRAVVAGLDEIRLLEHNYIFREFAPMYEDVCSHSDFVNDWFCRKAGFHDLEEYLGLIKTVRKREFPVRILFGLEVCYFKEQEEFIADMTRDLGLDFLIGSMHFVDNFAFDHNAELWSGIDVDRTYRRYFEDSVSLVKSRLFDGIGHPDTLKLFGHRPSFTLTGYYEELAEVLAERGMYADQNSGAHRRCPETAELGMDRELLHILKEKGVTIITSSDAHCPEDVGDSIRELEICVEEA